MIRKICIGYPYCIDAFQIVLIYTLSTLPITSHFADKGVDTIKSSGAFLANQSELISFTCSQTYLQLETFVSEELCMHKLRTDKNSH